MTTYQLRTRSGHLFPQESELLWELLQEEGEELLVIGLVHVVLPFGHIPGRGVGWHHVVWKHLLTTWRALANKVQSGKDSTLKSHLEQLFLKGCQQLAGDAMEGS